MSVDAAAERRSCCARAGARPARGALVREAQRGSAEALEELFRRHWRRAHRAAFLVVGDAAAAEDIAQESFLAAIRALDRFDRRRPFGPWLHRITVNRAIDFARARALRGERALGVEREAAGPGAATRSPTSCSRRCATSAPSTARCRAALRARVHAGRDRADPRAAARDRQLAAAARRSTDCGRRSRRQAVSRAPRPRARAPARASCRPPARPRPRSARGRSCGPRTPSHPGPARRRAAAGSPLAVAAGAVALAIGLSPAGAKVARPGRRRGRDRRAGRRARSCASLPAAGELLVAVRPRAVDRPRGRLQAAARRLRRRDLVAARASTSPSAAGRELVALEHRGRRALDLPGARRRPRPALGRAAPGHPDRLPERRRPAGDRRRRTARQRSPDRPQRRPRRARLAPDRLLEARPDRALGFVLSLRGPARGTSARVDADTGARVAATRATTARRTDRSPSTGRAEDRALSPDGSPIARPGPRGTRDRLLAPRRGGRRQVLFSARGRLTGPTWSPDGRWLLVGWPAADQWLFIDADSPAPGRRLRAGSPSSSTPAASRRQFPSVLGWILPER